MTLEEFEHFHRYTDRILHMRMTDGEQLTIKLLFVDDEYQDIIYDVISSDQANRYEKPFGTTAFVTPYDQIASFELVEEGP